jgi:hypothetical protein
MSFVLLSVACGAESDGGTPVPRGEADPAAPEAAGGTGSGGEQEAALPGPCREPAPPHLCLLLSEALASETEPVDSRQVRATFRFGGQVAALGEGYVPSGVESSVCAPEFGIDEGMARSGTHPAWVQLDLGGSTALLSVSAPPEGLGLGIGDRLEVAYSVVDDLLQDFEPTTRSLVVRSGEGSLRFWLATSESVVRLSDEAVPEVGLQAGPAQCEVIRTCSALIQQELDVSLGGTQLGLAQGDLASAPGWRVLAGQSEVFGDDFDCTVDGSPQLASVGVWRLPD